MRELTEDEKVQVEALAAYLSQEQIADYFKIGKTTWFEIIKRDPEVSERYKRGKAKAIAIIGQGLLERARAGDTASTIFYLKTQAGWREKQEVEQDQRPINITISHPDAGK